MPSLIRLICLFGLLAWPLAAAAQEYPSKAVKFVVPFPAGGPADTIARILGDKLSALLGQPVVIESRAGAGGLTGTASVAKSEPDGHTIGIAASSALAINVNLRDNMPFQPLKDFRLVTQIVSVPEILVVGEGVPAQSLAELIALAKGGAKLTFGSPGPGTSPHISGEMLNHAAGIGITHVPFRGLGPALNNLLGGHIDLITTSVIGVLPYVEAKTARALAVFDSERSGQLPDIPTTVELGFPELVMPQWYGLLAPAGLPPDVRGTLEQQVLTVLRSPEVTAQLAASGVAGPKGASELQTLLDAEFKRWPILIPKLGIKPE